MFDDLLVSVGQPVNSFDLVFALLTVDFSIQ